MIADVKKRFGSSNESSSKAQNESGNNLQFIQLDDLSNENKVVLEWVFAFLWRILSIFIQELRKYFNVVSLNYLPRDVANIGLKNFF